MSYPAALSLRIGRYVPSISFFIFSRLSSTIGVSRCTLFEAEALSGSSSLICEMHKVSHQQPHTTSHCCYTLQASDPQLACFISLLQESIMQGCCSRPGMQLQQPKQTPWSPCGVFVLRA